MTISINGTFVDSIQLTGNEPEFAAGYGVFETLRTYAEKPFELPAHLRRLYSSADDIKLAINSSNEDITQWVEQHCETQVDKKIKIIAAPEKIYVLSEPLAIDEAVYTNGVGVRLYHLERRSPSIKSLSYREEYLANHIAKTEGYHDALLIDEKKEVREGAHSNFFFVRDNVIHTSKHRILQGITRRVTLAIAEPHYQLELNRMFLDTVMLADECFLTQSTYGVVPVTRIDNHTIGNGAPGSITQNVMDLFNDYVAQSNN